MEKTNLILYGIGALFLCILIIAALSKKKSEYDNGYNDQGFDINGKNKKYYKSKFKEIDKVKNKAKKSMYRDIDIALFYYGKVFEHLLKCISLHCILGECETTAFEVLKKISDEKIFDVKFIDNLHKVRKLYNNNKHELNDENYYKNKNFMIKTTDKLYSETKKILDI